ncbi:hypothetical protein [Flammeovirga aprica]|uniref:Uncharacterized protein n=1 Tax=Flammeovirga aprica JL-4 TaxID=694437 RepID=A0A7X9RYW1_9BACT|nr:hypothetical protein [Flammeovirga aprica]NME71225.1 hypothetical protein [Flammeovirga aprica JL-4]
MMKKLFSIIVLLVCIIAVNNVHAQNYTYYSEDDNTSVNNNSKEIDKLEDEIFNLEMDKKRAEQKLSSNRTVKTIGISMDAVSLFILWPLVIPGTIMWIASPTKKHVRAIEGYEYTLHKKKQELRNLQTNQSI